MSATDWTHEQDNMSNDSHENADQQGTTQMPRIKLTLRLNPTQPPPSAEDEAKKKRHKHKKKHKKHKKRHSTDNEETLYSNDLKRRESEQVNIEDVNVDSEDDYHDHMVHHIPVGGKRPMASIVQEELNKQEHSMDSQSFRATSVDTQDDEGGNVLDSVHPTDSSSGSNVSSNLPKLLQPPHLDRPPRKRGRPSKKQVAAEAAAEAAYVERVQSELAKKDFVTVCGKLLDSMIKRDSYGLFLEPVDTSIITDYLSVIKKPMDFTTMRQKLESRTYQHMDEFRSDFLLITTNAKTYNAPNTIYWKNADRLEQMGLKAIERAEKTVSYESMEETLAHLTAGRQNSWPRKLSIVPVKREAGIKTEEEVDILGLDTLSTPMGKMSRQGSGSTTRETSVDFLLTPRTPSKKKKKKAADMGVLYGPDGAINAVGGVADLYSLLPSDPAFCAAPQLVTANPQAMPSAFYTTKTTHGDDWFAKKHFVHPAFFCDYGPFTTLGVQAPGDFYTAQDATYIYPLYGTGQGEAYMRSLWEFVDGIEPLHNVANETSRKLTRGAWDVVQQVLDKDDSSKVDTEFGQVDVPQILSDMKPPTPSPLS